MNNEENKPVNAPISVDIRRDGVEARVSRLPVAYQIASWRNTTPVDDAGLDLGVGFNLADGQVVRLRLSLASSYHLAQSIEDALRDHRARVHAAVSHGIPSVDMSIPDDGLKV